MERNGSLHPRCRSPTSGERISVSGTISIDDVHTIGARYQPSNPCAHQSCMCPLTSRPSPPVQSASSGAAIASCYAQSSTSAAASSSPDRPCSQDRPPPDVSRHATRMDLRSSSPRALR
eukprot:6875936-Prymnesium_polylepis.1